MFREGRFTFLVTNKHVVVNNLGKIADSIFVYENKPDTNGEVISGPQYITVYLTRNTIPYYSLPDQSDIDLVIISVGRINSALNGNSSVITSHGSTIIPDSASFPNISDSNILTCIGYPAKVYSKSLDPRSPEYRWGKLISSKRAFLETDIPILPGSSGSPVFLNVKSGYSFVGIMTRKLGDRSFAIPSYFIRSHFAHFFSQMEKQLKEN